MEQEINKTNDNTKSRFIKLIFLISWLFVVAIMVTVSVGYIMNTVDKIENYAQFLYKKKYPDPHKPVARFVANMNWNDNSIKLDATMSKTYNNKIEKYIWRIDDGTGIVGGDKLEHKFIHPGLYTIQLSLVDDLGQSDSASCTLYFAPAEIETVEINKESKLTTEYIPKGTFFNLRNIQNASLGELKSNYISSTCGLSSNTYNQFTNLNSDSIKIKYLYPVITKGLAQLTYNFRINFLRSTSIVSLWLNLHSDSNKYSEKSLLEIPLNLFNLLFVHDQ